MGAYPLAAAAPQLLTTLEPGGYFEGMQSLSTSATLGNGNLRLVPFWTPSPFHVSQIGAEFTVAGDVPSVLALAVYADNGLGFPSSLLSSPGSISTGTGNAGTVATGGTPGVYMIPLAVPLLVPAGVSWWGGVVQGVTVTQPTIRTGTFNAAFAGVLTSVPGPGATTLGYLISGIPGALPAQFGAFPQGVHANAPRLVGLISSVP